MAIGAKDSTKAFNFDFSYWSHDVSAQPLSIFSIFIKNSYVIACTIKYTGTYLFSKQYRKTWEKILFAFFFSNSNISICKKSTVGKSTFPCQNSSTYKKISTTLYFFYVLHTINYWKSIEKYDAKCFYFFLFSL